MAIPRLQRAAVSAALALLLGACSSSSHTTTPATSSTSGPLPPHQSGKTYAVTAYDGCRGDGITDCYAGMQAAIDAAQAAGGGTVLFPKGVYSDGSHRPLVIAAGPAITLSGDNRDTSRIIANSSPHATLLYVRADHVVIENLTFDSSAVHDGLAVVGISTNYTSVLHCRVLGGPGTSWPLRFAGGGGKAQPTHPSYATGNRVDDLILEDSAPVRNDGLDFSFQENATINNVQHTGSRLGLYVDRNVTVSDYRYTPAAASGSGAYGYYISPPSLNITITGFTTSGNGGKIGPIPPANAGTNNVNITINNEKMLNRAFQIFIGDATNLTIRNSILGIVRYAPRVNLQGVMTDTTYGSLVRAAPPTVKIDVQAVRSAAG